MDDHGDHYDFPDESWDADHSSGGEHDGSDWLTGDEHEPWADHSHEPEPGFEHESEPDADFTPHSEAPSHAADFEPEPVSHDDHPYEPQPDHGPSIGADPDLPEPAHSSDAWLDLPDLHHVELPEPAGGGPWIDTAFLGASSVFDVVPAHPVGVLDDLRVALGEPSSTDMAFEQLLASDDPAVRALAQLWRP
jgi:hypothetical protein